MPKLELKPWKIGEPQVVYEFKNYDGRLQLEIIFRKKGEKRIINVLQLYRDDEDNLQTIRGEGFGLEEPWKDEFVNLLGIPETIEANQ